VKSDIIVPKVEGVGIAIVKDVDEGDVVYKAYIINFNNFPIENILITSKGYGLKDGKSIKTATFRHFFDKVEAYSYQQIEVVSDEVFGLNNEFFVTYYIGKLIHDKKYIFLPEVISVNNFIEIKVLEKEGVLIK
jgi:hypothetical protein